MAVLQRPTAPREEYVMPKGPIIPRNITSAVAYWLLRRSQAPEQTRTLALDPITADMLAEVMPAETMLPAVPAVMAIIWPHADDNLMIPAGGQLLTWLDTHYPSGDPAYTLAGIILTGCIER
ncbi:MAG TPA: hypothetical protein VMR98_04395, partial [Candidatus Polarisedimenticolaceae bacterium]|nr:hypothetical protein [Candidatus Polarisedimenticolaceae bacterium]